MHLTIPRAKPQRKFSSWQAGFEGNSNEFQSLFKTFLTYVVGTKRQEINRMGGEEEIKIQQNGGRGGKLQLELRKLQTVSGIAVQDPAQLVGGKPPIAIWICLWAVMTLHRRRLGFRFEAIERCKRYIYCRFSRGNSNP